MYLQQGGHLFNTRCHSHSSHGADSQWCSIVPWAEDQERFLFLCLKLTGFMTSGKPFTHPVSVGPICKHRMDDSCMKLSFRGLLKGFLKDHLCLLDKTKILLCRCQDSTLSPRIWQKRAIFKDCPEPYMACDGLRKECPGTSVTTGFLSDNGSTPEQKSWLYSALHPILHWGVREKCRNRCFRGLQSTEERKRLPGCLICALSIIKLLRIQLW